MIAMNAPKTLRITKAKQKLAAGVLTQARRDLRRFYQPKTTAERELFLDAYSWLVSDNDRWPFSFRNVCRLLDRAPEALRRELLGEVSLGAVPYWSRRVGDAVRGIRGSVREVLVPARSRLAHS